MATKFITIDDKIISGDLSDLQVLSYPGPSLVSFPQHKNDTPGRFVLRVNRLDYLEHACLIPDGATRSFNLVIYEGLPNDKSTWKEVTNFGDCIFDISEDRVEWLRFQYEQLSPLKPEGEPTLYYLAGTYREYQSAYACWDGFDNARNTQAPSFLKPDGPKDNYEYLP